MALSFVQKRSRDLSTFIMSCQIYINKPYINIFQKLYKQSVRSNMAKKVNESEGMLSLKT